MDLASYSEAHPHFFVDNLSPLLVETARAQPPGALADLGAGDGAVIFALAQRGLLGERTIGIDLSSQRVERLSGLDGVEAIVSDATKTPLDDASVDAVIVTQVIEHLPDDRLLPPEIARVLKPGGWFYVSSVLRGPRAWWVYRLEDGRWGLDPTHLREYPTPAAFAAALEHPDLKLGTVRGKALRFPLIDLALRGAGALGIARIDSVRKAYQHNPRLEALRKLRVRVPGYSLVEAVGVRTDTP